MRDHPDLRAIITYLVDATGAQSVQRHGVRPDPDGRVFALLRRDRDDWQRFLQIPVLDVQTTSWGAQEATWDASRCWERSVVPSAPTTATDSTGALYSYWPQPEVGYVAGAERRFSTHLTPSELLSTVETSLTSPASRRTSWFRKVDPLEGELAEVRAAWRRWSQDVAPTEAAKVSLRAHEILLTSHCLSLARSSKLQQTVRCIRELFDELIGYTITPMTWLPDAATKRRLAGGQLPIRPLVDINWLIQNLLDQIRDAEEVIGANAWALENGTTELRHLALSGQFDDEQAAYFSERLAEHLPGWQFLDKVSLRTPQAPSMKAVDLLLSLRAEDESVDLVLADGREALRREFMGRIAYRLVV